MHDVCQPLSAMRLLSNCRSNFRWRTSEAVAWTTILMKNLKCGYYRLDQRVRCWRRSEGTSSKHRTCFLLDSELSHTEYPCPRVTEFNQIPLSRLKSVAYCNRATLVASVVRNPSSGRMNIPKGCSHLCGMAGLVRLWLVII